MFELRPLSKEAIPSAIERAKHYRLLNDPWQAQSICQDILRADPENQAAIHILVLAITDQFESKFRSKLSQALEMCALIHDPYDRTYCKGLIYERQATAALKRKTPRSGYIAYEHLRHAMEWYDKADKSHERGNEEAILRWNACARMIMEYKLEAATEEKGAHPLLDV